MKCLLLDVKQQSIIVLFLEDYFNVKFYFLTICCLFQFIYEGISHLNEDQEKRIQKDLDRKEMFQGVQRYVRFIQIIF
jgi:hypothetical protein